MSSIPTEPVQRLCYLVDVEGWAALRDVESGQGIALAWDSRVFPHAWLWEETGGPEFPWYGRARIVAIEPMSSWPDSGLAAAVRRGDALELGPGQSMKASLALALFEASARRVTSVSLDGHVEQE